MSETEVVRIDKWLWAARFFKTRQLAAEAVSGGKVHINGQRCKPSREVKIGDLININKDQCAWEIRVTELNKQRRPAKEAVLLYNEDAASINKRLQMIELHKQQTLLHPYDRVAKPNKKQRRQIHRFKQDAF
jgi:ribosome-associated heat shock protein Hsp15